MESQNRFRVPACKVKAPAPRWNQGAGWEQDYAAILGLPCGVGNGQNWPVFDFHIIALTLATGLRNEALAYALDVWCDPNHGDFIMRVASCKRFAYRVSIALTDEGREVPWRIGQLN
jgi:hypothetical protein